MKVVSIGEVLWDVIGSVEHLGGAPFNFAAACQKTRARSDVHKRAWELMREGIAFWSEWMGWDFPRDSWRG